MTSPADRELERRVEEIETARADDRDDPRVADGRAADEAQR